MFGLWYCCPTLEVFNLEGVWAGLLHAACLAVFGMGSGYLTRRWIVIKLEHGVDLTKIDKFAKQLEWVMLAIVLVSVIVKAFNA
ncbi:hypothetical protein AAX09_02335 [Moraxella bovoculi]|nr:hypothetical protein AAX09_02335 [Moraxella bovoculi]